MIRPLSSNFYIVVIAALGLGSVVYLFAIESQFAQVYMVAALPIIVGIVAQLQKAKEVEVKVDAAVTSSQQNHEKLVDVVAKVDDNTEVTNTTHQIVNSRMDEFKAALKEVNDLKVAMMAERAATVAERAELTAAKAMADGIAIGREQTGQTDPIVVTPDEPDHRP